MCACVRVCVCVCVCVCVVANILGQGTDFENAWRSSTQLIIIPRIIPARAPAGLEMAAVSEEQEKEVVEELLRWEELVGQAVGVQEVEAQGGWGLEGGKEWREGGSGSSRRAV